MIPPAIIMPGRVSQSQKLGTDGPEMAKPRPTSARPPTIRHWGRLTSRPARPSRPPQARARPGSGSSRSATSGNTRQLDCPTPSSPSAGRVRTFPAVRAGAAPLDQRHCSSGLRLCSRFWVEMMFSWRPPQGRAGARVLAADAEQQDLGHVAKVEADAAPVRPAVLADFVPDDVAFVGEPPVLPSPRYPSGSRAFGTQR
jgi:hypothetical protein